VDHPNVVVLSLQGFVEGAEAYVRPEHLASFGGEGADWNGLIVRVVGTPVNSVINEGEDTITGWNPGLSTMLEIPASINGLPVTHIAEAAFENSRWQKIVIPEGVISIGSGAFRYCSALRSVTIPDSVEVVGAEAFLRCSRLTDLTLGSGIEVIGESAFRDCRALESVTIPDSVRMIETSAFQECFNLMEVSLGSGIESIALKAFSSTSLPAGDDGLVFLTNSEAAFLVNAARAAGEIVIPAEFDGRPVKSYNVFAWNSGITKVTLEEGITEIGFFAFANCGSLATVVIPASVTRIEAEAFHSCKQLTDSVIPGGVTTIVDRAFFFCSRLNSLTLPPSLEQLGTDSFSHCRDLTTVTIPLGLAEIGDGAFSHCSSLESVTILNGVISIEDGAFSNCRSLTSVTIPESVTRIGRSAFAYCLGLPEIVIPDGITMIEQTTFIGCRGLTSFTIPDSVLTVGKESFQDCSSLTEITIPNGVKTLGEAAFSVCENLETVVLGSGVEQIGQNAFFGTKLVLKSSGVFGFLTNEVSAFLVDARSASGEVVIPATFEGLPVVSIEVFENNDDITKVVIPESVTRIAPGAFQGCSNLISVTIPASVTEIGENAFVNCFSLAEVTIPAAVVSIGTQAFASCESLQTVTFEGAAPESVGERVFVNIAEGARAFVKPEHLASFDELRADWNGLSGIGAEVTPVIGRSAFGEGFLTIWFSAEPTITDWRIVGSGDLANFDADLTAEAVITETTPGEYRAVVDVSGKPQRYFLQVKR